MKSVEMMATRVIKRYENRKLYDTTTSRYVSLKDIASLVRAGETVQVIDNVSGQDITAQTLTQIILEEGRQGRPLISTDLLHEVLRKGEAVLESSLGHLKEGVDEWLGNSLSKLQSIFPYTQNEEIQQLRAQVARLEAMIEQLLAQQEKTTNHNQTGR